MRELNSFAMLNDAGARAKLDGRIDFDDGLQCTMLEIESQIPMRNTTNDERLVTREDIIGVCRVIFGTINLGFGAKSYAICDGSYSFDQARMLSILMTGRDFLVGIGNQRVPLRSYVNGSLKIPKGKRILLPFFFRRTFAFERLGANRLAWCPGATQMRQLRLEFIRGAGFPDGFEQDGDAAFHALAHHAPEEAEDQWAAPPRLHVASSDGMYVNGPPPGGVLAMWEESAPGEKTPLGLISLERDGDSPIHKSVHAHRIVRESLLVTPPEHIDPNEFGITLLFQLPNHCRLEDVPTGTFVLRQHQQYVSKLRTVWLYAPEIDDTYADKYVGPNALVEMPDVKIATTRNVSPHTASILPVSLLRKESTLYDLVPGFMYAKEQEGEGQRIETNIPSAVITRAVAALSLQPNQPAQEAVLSHVLSDVLKTLPGGTSPKRGDVRPVALELANQIAPRFPGLFKGAIDRMRKRVSG